MAALDFPSASASPWVAPNGAIYTYIGTSPNGYWEANTANAAQNLTDLFVEKSGSTMTGALKLDNAGNVALPDISFDGDVNTGLYSPSADSLALVTGGSARLNIDSTGSVVVSGTLTSAGNITASDIIINSAGTAAAPSYRFGLGTGFFSSTGTGNVSISTNSTERFTIDSSGNAAFTHPVTSNASINVAHSSAASSSIQAWGAYAAGVNTSSIKTDGTAVFGASINLQGSGAQCALGVDGDDFTFKTIDSSGGAFQEGMRIIGGVGAGNVGINTTSPSYRLQLGDNTSSPTATPEVLSLGATYSNTAGDNPKLRLWDQNSTNYMGIGVSGSQIDYICKGAYDHVFHTSSSERMRITSGGLVGIGTSTPVDELNFGQSLNISGPNGASFIAKNNNSSTYCGIFGYYANQMYMLNKAAGPCLFYTTNTEHAQLSATGYIHASPQGATTYYGKVSPEFHSFNQGGVAQWTAGFRNTHTSPYGVIISYSGASPYSNGYHFIYAADAAAVRFSVASNGGIANYSGNNTNLCDEREKKNIVSLETKWDKVKNWELRKFHYNDDADTDDLRYGVIAQEVETENPELITAFTKQRAEDSVLDEDGTVVTPAKEEILRKGVKEQQMMWMAIKALQEAMAKIETLETKVAALEAG